MHEGGQHSGQRGQEHVVAVVELAGSGTKRVSNKRVDLEICDKPWLVFGRDREKHGRDPRIKLERRRPQRLRHRRPKPCFVAGVKLLDFAIVQSVNLISGECFPTDHQSILPGLAPRRDGRQPFTVLLHPFFLLRVCNNNCVWRRRWWSPLSAPLHKQLIDQFITVNFAVIYCYCESAGPSNMECDSAQTLCDLPGNSTTRCVPSTAISSPSVTSYM